MLFKSFMSVDSSSNGGGGGGGGGVFIENHVNRALQVH